MNRVAVDLHIHSCVSPCAEDDVTPRNIVGMALVKGLELIALTDHNSTDNLPAIVSEAGRRGLAVLPGMELESLEGVHVLAYFRALDAAMAFGSVIRGLLPNTPNMPAFFGNQLIVNARDQLVGKVDNLLVQPLNAPLDQLTDMVITAGGLAVPAHVNRPGSGLLAIKGVIPPGAPYSALEVWRSAPVDKKAVAGYLNLYSSDAHRLGDISEREFFLPLAVASADVAFEYLAQNR